MNKTELIEKIASSAEISKVEAARLFNTVIDEITDALSKDQQVAIVGFGTFKVSKRKERIGRNPRTGATIKIAAQKTPRFSAGKLLKQACNRKAKK
jgi:DNA-binding protein HU-beta